MSDSVTGTPWGDLRASVQKPCDQTPVIDAAPGAKISLHYTLWPKRQAAFLVELCDGERLHRIPHGFGLTIEEVVAAGKRWIVLSCSEGRLEEVFQRLCSRIRDLVTEQEVPGSQAVGSAVSEFRDLLVAGKAPAFGRDRLLGLLGELHVLERMLTACPGAVRCWVGPTGARHDFKGRGGALEVKTSSGPNTNVVSISSFAQLEPPADSRLWLCHVVLDEPGARTLAEIVSTLEYACQDPQLLRQRLTDAGVADPSDPEWNKMAVDCVAIRAYRVEEGFPSITPTAFRGGRIPQGVVDAGYLIDLDACASFRIPSAELRLVLDSICAQGER